MRLAVFSGFLCEAIGEVAWEKIRHYRPTVRVDHPKKIARSMDVDAEESIENRGNEYSAPIVWLERTFQDACVWWCSDGVAERLATTHRLAELASEVDHGIIAPDFRLDHGSCAVGAEIGCELFTVDCSASSLDSFQQRILEAKLLEQCDDVRETFMEGVCVGASRLTKVRPYTIENRVGGLVTMMS